MPASTSNTVKRTLDQRWDPNTQTVVSPKERRLGALAIQSSHFDAQAYKTVLQLAGASGPVEIEL
jgi:hypothetical protein